MKKSSEKGKALIWKIVLLCVLLFFIGLSVYMYKLPEMAGKLDTRLICSDVFCPGTSGMVRIVTLNYETKAPVKGGKVEIGLEAENKYYRLFTGKCNEKGTADAFFNIPPEIPEGEGELTVKVSSSEGNDKITEKIKLSRNYKIYLTTDKPLYQPGQTIHIRALSMMSDILMPLKDRPATIEVQDPEGNKILKTLDKKTSDYGIVSTDFILSDEAEEGEYLIKVLMGESAAETSVKVEKYVLPKFKMDLSTDKKFYRPGERLKGEIRADYFFGKPVSEGKIRIELACYDGVSFNKFSEIEGLTDKDGYFKFEEEVKESDETALRCRVEVTDKTGRKESKEETFYVSENTITITPVPESGDIPSGMENIIYFVTSYPDGSPAKADLILDIEGEKISLKTSKAGIGEFLLKPEWSDKNISVTAVDEKGNSGVLSYNPYMIFSREALLLRPDKAIYYEGDVVKLDIFSYNSEGTVYLDLVKNNQIKMTESSVLKDEKASIEFPLPQGLLGTLEINAYRMVSDGDFIRDTRTIYVVSKKELSLDISSDKDLYRPGKSALVNFEVKDKAGNPVTSALGISVVDESVLAMSEKEPGFEKVYFTLEEEALEQGNEVCRDYTEKTAANLLEDKRGQEEQEMAKVAFASLTGSSYKIMKGNTYPERLNRAVELKETYFSGLKSILPWAVVLFIFITVLGLFLVTVDNEICKRENKNRFLPVNEENFMPVIIYFAGFFIVMMSPFLVDMTAGVLLVLIDISYQAREFLRILFSLVTLILLSLFYIRYLEEKRKIETIKGLKTFADSFRLVQLFMGEIVILSSLLLIGMFPHTGILTWFSEQRIPGIMIIISVLLMPFILIYNVLSHISEPGKMSLFRKAVKKYSVIYLGIVFLILIISFTPVINLFKNFYPLHLLFFSLGVILLPIGLMGLTFYNNYLSGKNEKAPFSVNNESLEAVITYFAGFYSIILLIFIGFVVSALMDKPVFLFTIFTVFGLFFALYIVYLIDFSKSGYIQEMGTFKYSILLVLISSIGIEAYMLIIRNLPLYDFNLPFLLANIILISALMTYNAISHTGSFRKLEARILNSAYGIILGLLTVCMILSYSGLGEEKMYQEIGTIKDEGYDEGVDEGYVDEGTTEDEGTVEDYGIDEGTDEGKTAQEMTASEYSDEIPGIVFPKISIGLDERTDEGTVTDESFGFKENGASQPGPSKKLPPYIRHYFPETMYFNPELITDEQGRGTLELQMADTITSWRMGVTASSLNGGIGGADFPLRVFQDFFIEPDLPAELTEGDEIWIPVAVYNYLSEEQVIKLEVKEEDWFTLRGKKEQQIKLPAGDVGVLYYPIKVKGWGKKKFTIYGETEKLNDAVTREVKIIPDGKELRFSENGWLRNPVVSNLNIPENSIDKSYDLRIKIYPAIFSQIVEGLDTMLSMPHG